MVSRSDYQRVNVYVHLLTILGYRIRDWKSQNEPLLNHHIQCTNIIIDGRPGKIIYYPSTTDFRDTSAIVL